MREHTAALCPRRGVRLQMWQKRDATGFVYVFGFLFGREPRDCDCFAAGAGAALRACGGAGGGEKPAAAAGVGGNGGAGFVCFTVASRKVDMSRTHTGDSADGVEYVAGSRSSETLGGIGVTVSSLASALMGSALVTEVTAGCG